MTKNILKTLTISAGFALATVFSAHAASTSVDSTPAVKATEKGYVQLADGHKAKEMKEKGSQKGEEMKEKGSQKGEEMKDKKGSAKGEKKGSY